MRTLFTLCILILLSVSCSPLGRTAAPESPLTLEDCALTTPAGIQLDARCGTLTVPENRLADPTGRQIDLYVAVIPAIKRNPEPDPLFLLAGGPGQSAIETFPAMIRLMNQIHQDRDIVLVDQRGTGESNPLRCLTDEDELLDEEQVLDKLQTCPETLEADLRFYHTEIAMRDLDDVRAALGYETINLYGASYGTRAALTYLRMFPERVRTLTLDAVVDPEFILFLDAGEDGQIALDHFFTRCEADSACSTNFPELRSEFEGLLARVEGSTVEITIPHPVTNEPLDLTVTEQLILNMVFNTLYVPDLVATLPLSLHEAYADENYVPLISQAYLVNAGIYDGMFYAVTCTEDAPLISEAEAIERSEGSVFGDRTLDFVDVCAEWPKGEVSSEFREPITSDIPVLILSGEADPITPPSHAEALAETLTNETHLVFGGMGHGNLASRCTMGIFNDFLETATTAGLETACVENIEPPPFFVDFSGPRP